MKSPALGIDLTTFPRMPMTKQTHLETQGIRPLTQIKEGLEKGVRERAVIYFSEVRKETFLKAAKWL